MLLTGNKIVDEVSKMHINSIPEAWYKTIRKNNQPYALAILVLWEIVYWYKWTEVRSEETGCVIAYKKKFNADLLQRSYSQLAEKFGISKKVATEVINFLATLGVITKDLRKITTANTVLNNVLYIGINTDVLKKLSSEENNIDTPVSQSGDTLPPNRDTPSLPVGVDPLSQSGDTYTTITTTNSTTITTTTNSISSETKVSSEIPFPEPEDVEPKKIKRTRTASKKTTDENSVSFPKESYTEVMDLYYDTRLSLNNQMTVTDEVYKYNIYTPLLKKYFELYGVEKCKLAIKNASTNEWVRNKTDFGLRTIFNDKMITKWIEDTSVVTNKALRHDMFFNDPKHSHIDYENQDYSEEF